MTHPTSTLRRVRRLKSIPLRIVLVVPFVLEVMLAVSLTAYMVYRNGQDAVDDLASQLVVKISDRVEDGLDNYLQTPFNITRSNANAIQVGILNWQNRPMLERYFSQQLLDIESTGSEIHTLLFLDKNKKFFSIKKQAKLESSQQSTHSALTQVPSYRVDENPPLYFLPKDNVPSLPTVRHRLSGEQATKQFTSSQWQLLVDRSVSSEPTLVAAYLQPFYDQSNTLQGVIGVSIDLSQVSQYLEQLKVSQTGQVFIVERNGSLIATSTKESPLRKVPLRQINYLGKNSQIVPNQKSSNTDTPIPLQRLNAVRSLTSVTQLTAEALIKEFGSFEQIADKQLFTFEANNTRYFVQVSPVQNRHNLDWLAIVVIPESDFTAQIQRNHYIMLMMCSAALIGAIGLGVFTAQQIAKPILRLSRASRDFMLGKLDDPIQEKSHISEIAILAHAFNEMTEHLQESFDQVKQALQESKEKFTTVFRTSPDPILVTTLPDGMIVEANDSFLSLLDLSREETIDHTAASLGLWSNLEDRKHFLQAIEQSGRVHNYEASTLTRTGRKVTVLVSSERIELEGQSYLLTVSKDITERKQLEEALRESEAKLQNVLNSATAAICRFWLYQNGDLKYDYFSPGHDRLFGLDSKEMMGNTDLWRSRVHPEDVDKAVGIIPPSFKDGNLTTEYRFYHTDGSLRWISDCLTFHWDATHNRWDVTAIAFDITEQKQTEAALQQSEARYRSVVNSIKEIIFQTDAFGQWTFLNPAWTDTMGFPVSESIGTSVLDYVHPDDQEHILEYFKLLIAHQEDDCHREIRCLTKKGEVRWVEIFAHSTVDPNGMIMGVSGTFNDITNRKQVEEALRISEAQFRSAFDTAAIGMNITSLEGKFLRVNPRLCQMLGYTEAELLEMSYQMITHPDDLITDANIEQQLIEGYSPYHHFEKRLVHKEGQIIWALANVSIVRDDSEQPLFIVAQMQDITARKQVEEALRHSEARFRAAFDTAMIGMSIFDLTGKFLDVNASLCKMYGYSESELLHMTLQDVTHPDDLETDLHYLKQAIAGELDFYLVEKRNICKGGRMVRVLLSTSIVRDPNYRPLYFISQVEDIGTSYV